MTGIHDKTLYGSDRESRKNALKLAKKLQSSSVLGSGEYNYTYDKLKDSVWNTSKSTDFPGIKLDKSHTIAGVTQLNEHFRFGNDSGQDVPPAVYSKSTTKEDFTKKLYSKPSVLAENRTVNWPDMAPQYRQAKGMGESEYNNTFDARNRSSSAPTYPKVKTAIMQLPLDPERFHVQRGSMYIFGNDERSKMSEHQRAFGRNDNLEDFSDKLARGNANDTMKRMKIFERASNVFRGGDYNNAAGNKESTTVNDFGPRTKPPGKIQSKKSASSVRSSGSREGRPGNDYANLLMRHARDEIVPGVFLGADETRVDQTNAHFQFGTDAEAPDSVYGKDYALSALASRAVPVKAFTKDAGKLLQNDPEFSGAARSLNSSDFMALPRPLQKMSENNAGKKYVDHISVSLDPSLFAEDRQKSVAHSDFNKHPSNYLPIPPFSAKAAPFKYLETDLALPYPGLERGSEAENNFTSTFMQGIYAMDRRRQKENACKGRASNFKGTHFVVGYAPGAFTSESVHQYAGRKKNDGQVPPAGKTEKDPNAEFDHISQSKNTQDLRHNDPYTISTKEGVRARQLYEPALRSNPFETSIMKEDYKSLNKRSLNESQMRMIHQNKKLLSKPIGVSHFFHTDNSGTDQYRSMTMHDFIKPAESTGGRKFLAAL